MKPRPPDQLRMMLHCNSEGLRRRVIAPKRRRAVGLYIVRCRSDCQHQMTEKSNPRFFPYFQALLDLNLRNFGAEFAIFLGGPATFFAAPLPRSRLRGDPKGEKGGRKGTKKFKKNFRAPRLPHLVPGIPLGPGLNLAGQPPLIASTFMADAGFRSTAGATVRQPPLGSAVDRPPLERIQGPFMSWPPSLPWSPSLPWPPSLGNLGNHAFLGRQAFLGNHAFLGRRA